jgi:hypothetical protein
VRAEFLEHALHVVLGGFFGDHQLFGDAPIAEPAREQPGDLLLAARQAHAWLNRHRSLRRR